MAGTGGRGRPGRRLRRVDETSAGGLVVADDGVTGPRAALIGRTDRRGRLLWSLPKGHIEEGETPEDTAVREVAEETGIIGEVVAPLGIIDFWFVADGRRVHKTVHHFLLRAIGRRPLRRRHRGDRGRLGAAGRAERPAGLRRRAGLVGAPRAAGRQRVTPPAAVSVPLAAVGSRPLAAGVVTVLLLLAVLLPAAVLPGGAAAATVPAPAGSGGLTLQLTQMTPRVVTADGPATVTVLGTLRNTGDRSVGELEIRLQRGDALRTDGDVRDALAGTGRMDTVAPEFTPLPGVLDPGPSFRSSSPCRCAAHPRTASR